MNPETLRTLAGNHYTEGMAREAIAHAAAWEHQVNTLTNERDLARRANEQNIKIIKQLRRQLRKAQGHIRDDKGPGSY